MKVFGIGVMKTGTTTLGQCLKALGYNHASYEYPVVRLFMSGRPQIAWDRIEQFDSFDDWPYFLMYRDIAERYPDAKFILTTRRSPEKWLSSMDAHVYRVGSYVRHLHRHYFGAEFPENNPQAFLDFYSRHNEQVRAFFGNRLIELSWENGDGWQELCSALGKPVPDAPFPHTNTRESRRDRELAVKNWVFAKLEAREIRRYRWEYDYNMIEDDPRGPIAPHV